MIVLKAPTIKIKNSIEGQTKPYNLIEFFQDANGNWIVPKSILNDPKFSHITELNNLIEIDFNPIVTNLQNG